MAEFPFDIAALTRFCHAQRAAARSSRGLAGGPIDIVIGTHRLAQPDVQFHNLGLVIIDEEQRFGVEVKERLKALRQTVDVLTMTATPIPRTLHMSLLGLRDISNLETPPEDRLAVETRVTRFDAELIRHAVLRELNRGGQIFFVHNRVARHRDRRHAAAADRARGPHRRSATARCPSTSWKQVMLDFVDAQFDMLLATTIVESGLDIPNANTIFIDEADRYGLADLHQLRGRVGRYKHRAYCYLLIDPEQAPHAQRRPAAAGDRGVQRHGGRLRHRHARPGDPRGGQHPGHQQSGHIAAVGYELYCELLEKAVRRLKQLPPKTVDRGGRRSAGRGLHARGLRARHAAEDRPVPAAGAGDASR